MKQSIKVINIKCGGCANTIIKTLSSLGAKNILVDIVTGKLEFDYDGDLKIITDKLSSLGYPEVNSEEVKSFLKKAKSYMSCAIGKLS